MSIFIQTVAVHTESGGNDWKLLLIDSEADYFWQIFLITCSWHQKNETTNSTIQQITNSKSCKVSFKTFKMKKQGLTCFLKQWIKIIHQKRVLKGTLNSWIRGFGFFLCHEQVCKKIWNSFFVYNFMNKKGTWMFA